VLTRVLTRVLTGAVTGVGDWRFHTRFRTVFTGVFSRFSHLIPPEFSPDCYRIAPLFSDFRGEAAL